MSPPTITGTLLVASMVLIAVPLAGCLGASDAPAGSGPAIEDGVDDGPKRLTMAGCGLQVGVFFPPVEILGSPPDGFSHLGQDPAGATGTVIVAAETCRSASEDGSAVEEAVSEMHVYHVVDPPDPYEDDDVDHALLVHAVTSSREIASRYEAWNLTTPEVGRVAMTATAGSEAVRVGTASADAGRLSADLHTATQSREAARESLAVRLYGVADGTVTDVVDVTSTPYRAPTGTAELVLDAAGTDPADAVPWAATQGTTTGVGQHYVGDDLALDLVHRDPDAVRSG